MPGQPLGASVQPEQASKIGLIESRVDSLLGSSTKIVELSCKLYNKLLGATPSAGESEKDAKEPCGKLDTIRGHLDTAIMRLSIAENDLKLIDKETE